ncbi:hypothetical protein Tco_1129413, partial [Tanacetum coccineum]
RMGKASGFAGIEKNGRGIYRRNEKNGRGIEKNGWMTVLRVMGSLN